MIVSLLQKKRDEFGILKIYQEEYLHECRRTSFTWTEIPNTLCLATSKKYFSEALLNNNIKGIIVPPTAVHDTVSHKAVVVSEKADELFYFIHNKKIHEINGEPVTFLRKTGIAPSATISPSAIVGTHVSIGENVIIHDYSIILDNTIIKNNSVIYQNVTIGTQGLFTKRISGKSTHLEHFGGVEIGENCVIHAGTNIPRSVNFGEYTKIGDNVHIGAHSNIGHDSIVGNNCDISAKVLLSGRVKIGSHCWIGAGVLISNSVNVGDRASIKIGSVVIRDVPAGTSVSGNFAIRHEKNLRAFLRSEQSS
jgi:UDP-3-O-[3-hydroxymyristoyl] glucosamine N-acyltransferase